MANFLQTLIPLLFSVALLLAAANTAQSETTSYAYDFSTQQSTPLIFQGDAHLHSPNVRLTKTNASGYPQTYSVGRILLPDPLSFTWLRSFTSVISFYITPVASSPADGLTFFIAPVGTTIPDGSAGSNFGVFSPEGPNPNIFAVEFDTFFNNGVDEANSPHVGIDIESPRSSNVTVVGNELMGDEVIATIIYDQTITLITVSVEARGKRFEVSYVRDLSTVLKESQVGISGATGGSVAIFDISWWLFSTFSARPPPTTMTAASAADM